jgi:cytochrome c-type biogenesis protein CcmH/NrfG
MDQLGKSTVDSLYTLGDIYLTESLPSLAYGAYARAVALKPEQPVARAMKSAEQLASRGGAAEARKLVESIRAAKGTTLDEADTRKILKLDARLALAANAGGADAAATLEEVLKLDPLDGEALMLLAQHHSKGGRPDQAILYYERAARIDAFAAPAKVKIAQVYVSQGRFNDALPLLRDAQSIRPREDVARYLEQVERASKSKR